MVISLALSIFREAFEGVPQVTKGPLNRLAPVGPTHGVVGAGASEHRLGHYD